MLKEPLVKNNVEWDLVLKPKSGWFDLNLKEIFRYKDLIVLFVKRDLIATYKQTILGPLWHLLRPLLTTITFTIVFGKIAKLPTDGLPPILFYMAGIVCWFYFADCLNKTSDTFVANSNIFGKVYFPRLVLPISITISSLVSFIIQFVFFLLFIFYYWASGTVVEPSLIIIITPFLVLIMAMLGLGSGIIISSLTTKYRDLKFLVGFGVQLLMYASPVIFPLSTVEGKLKLILLANPMSAVIETFKFAYLGAGIFNWYYLLYSLVFAILILCLGILLFSKIEKNFMDTV